MTKRFVLKRSLMLVMLALLSLQVEECGKKSETKEKSAATVPDSLKRYPFRSAIIELRYGGSASGKQMIYIDDFGQKETTIDSLTMKMMDMEMPNYKMQIRRGDSLYEIDYVRGIASKGANPLSANDEKAVAVSGDSLAAGMGMKKQAREEVVAGQPCAVWISEQMGTKAWLWNNITLKSQATIGGDTILLDAVSVSLDVPVPAEQFVPPGDIHYTTVEETEAMLKEIDHKTAKHSKGKK